MTIDRNIAILGCGNMGSAIALSLLSKQIISPPHLTLIEKRNPETLKEFQAQGVRIHSCPEEYQGDFEILILAVKPQDSSKILRDIQSKVNTESLVISIMAGVTLSALKKGLGQIQIIRAMPNTPCAIGLGMTAFMGNERVGQDGLETSGQILETLGKAIQVDKEILIDAATAISGSGPAYSFYLAEALSKAAKEMGFTEEHAHTLATQTMLGAAGLLDRSPDSAQTLRQKVTSPGGTTEAAITSFDQNQIQQKLIQGFQAAFNRSQELGKS